MQRAQPPVVVRAAAGVDLPTASVVFLHGLGDSGHGWAAALQPLAVPHVRYVFPHAPSRNVTINDGRFMPAWCVQSRCTRAVGGGCSREPARSCRARYS
jgi:predicted esterase